MKDKLNYKELRKTHHDYVLASSGKYTLKADFAFELDKIVYHGITEGSGVIEVFDNLKKAVEWYNSL